VLADEIKAIARRKELKCSPLRQHGEEGYLRKWLAAKAGCRICNLKVSGTEDISLANRILEREVLPEYVLMR